MARTSFVRILLLLVMAGTAPLSAQVWEQSGGRLRSMQSEDGFFLLNYAQGNLTSEITASEDNLILQMFDDSSRVIRQVVWNKDYTVIEKEISYRYAADSVIPEQERQWYPAEQKLIVSMLTAEGLVCSRNIYVGSDSGAADELQEQWIWTYDARNRMETEAVTYGQNGKNSRRDFIWKEGFSQPDEQLYENGTLIREQIWQNDSDYTETLYFDKGFVITSRYEDGRQVQETVLSNDHEIRRTTW